MNTSTQASLNHIGTPIAPWFVGGIYTNPDSAHISINSPFVQWGWGVFTSSRIIKGVFLGKNLHIQRLLKQAEAIEIHAPSEKELQEMLQTWLSFFQTDQTPIRAKIILPQDAPPIFIAHSLRIDTPRIVSISCDPTDLLPKSAAWSTLKMTSHAEYRILSQRIRNTEYDDLILHTSEGYIVETTSSSLWFLAEGTFFYPDTSLGGIDSITSFLMRKIFLDMGYKVEPWKGSVHDIPSNSRCYISNCVKGIQAVRKIGPTQFFSVDLTEKETLDQALEKALWNLGISLA